MSPTPQLDVLKDRVYYSQNREDLILESFFPDIETGFYIDVGANDPVLHSVTKLFYEKGWRGINIEPIRRHYNALQRQRPRDINLNIGIGQKSGTLVFHEYTAGDGLSTFSNEMIREYGQFTDDVYKVSTDYSVKVKTLREVLRSVRVDKIHFLKVDVEGFEYDVLAGNDWDTYRPEVICIEANHVVRDWRPFLENNNYQLAFFDGLNEYYADSKTSRLAKFDFVKNVVLSKDGGIRNSDYRIVVALAESVQENQRAAAEVRIKLEKVQAASSPQQELYQALLAQNHQNHIRATIAEMALRNPRAFVKYQLRLMHRTILRYLSTQKKVPDYTKREYESRANALNELAGAATDLQRLSATQKLAKVESEKLERTYHILNHQSVALSAYLRLINGIKRLRVVRRAG